MRLVTGVISALVLIFLLLAVCVFAQAAPKLAWTQAGPTAAAVQAYTYKLFIDSAAGVVVAGVVCTGAASPFSCTGTLPTLTPGPHALQMSAAQSSVNESVRSDIYFVSTPAPQGVGLQ